ncbi:hypothetical protein Vafri_14688 [Volvox africanus]|nr:hypothetical protein Vafri_14688 [Volvox africanus]
MVEAQVDIIVLGTIVFSCNSHGGSLLVALLWRWWLMSLLRLFLLPLQLRQIHPEHPLCSLMQGAEVRWGLVRVRHVALLLHVPSMAAIFAGHGPGALASFAAVLLLPTCLPQICCRGAHGSPWSHGCH